jgi:3D (Asp-Asp-Asp) domain-containing protein
VKCREAYGRRPAAPLLIALLAAGATFLATTAAGAENASSLRSQAGRLRAANAALDAASHRALLELYALDSRLQRARDRLAALEARARQAADEERRAQLALRIARQSRLQAQQALLARARTLYIEGQPDPLAVILDASSLDDLISVIDSVNRVADQDARIIEELERTGRNLQAAIAAFEARRATLGRLTGEARQEQQRLAASRADKLRYLAELSRRKSFNAREIDALTRAASRAQEKARTIAPPSSSSPEPDTGSSSGAESSQPQPVTTADESPAAGRQVTVSATMYCLRGSTATGIPVGPGVVATDPAYIPLGTKMYIPGYGDGVAADTGGAVVGWTIDMWVASCSQADAYGRHTITITIFD